MLVPPERLNPTRAWVVGAYAIPTCGLWALSFALPWWLWLVIVALVGAGVQRASAIARAIVKATSEETSE